jgi:diacylglycerol kinase (ATP)
MNWISGRVRSFGFALRGIWVMLQTQPNARIHALATLLVICAGLFLDVAPSDWCWLVPAIAAVWVAEAFNTSIEFLADAVSAEYHPLIEKCKDAAAAAVLIAATGAGVIGLIVLGPYVMQLLR